MILNSNFTLISQLSTILCIGLVVFASGCQKSIGIKPNSDTKVIINSNFNPGDTWKVNVQRSKDLLDNTSNFEPITDAEASIYFGNNMVETLKYDRNQEMYVNTLGHLPKFNKKYKLLVVLSDGTIVQAEDKIPEASAKILEFNKIIFNNEFVEFHFHFEDIPDDANYYQVSLFEKTYTKITNGEGTIRLPDQTRLISYAMKDFEPIFGLESETSGLKMANGNAYIFADTEFNTKEKNVLIRISTEKILHDPENNVFSSFEVELRSLSKNYYDYQKSVTEQVVVSQNPLADPVQVHNNIKNGLGNFSGYSTLVSQNLSLE